jgi:DNA-binding winged helix-turn-helix (wHTH) protein
MPSVPTKQGVPITPAKLPTPRLQPVPTLRNETSLTAALCIMYKLRRSEAHVLMVMATRDFISPDEIQATVSRDRPVGNSTVSTHVSVLRKKLLPYNIEISTIRGFGYSLRKESRRKICQRLSKYDAELIPTAPPPPKRRGRTAQQELYTG